MKTNCVFKLNIVTHAFTKFIWFVLIYMVCSMFFDGSGNSDMAFFSAGLGMLSSSILWKGLILCFILAQIDIVFLTDKHINDLSAARRYLFSFAGTSIVVIIWVCLFHWVGTNTSNYVTFTIIFLIVYSIVFFLGIWLSIRLESHMYNKLLAEYKANIKVAETDEN